MSKANKQRADLLLVEQGSAKTRSKAQSLIMAGVVYCDTQRINKASEVFPNDKILTVKGEDHPYVSRGGVKLKGALDHFDMKVDRHVCLDVGVSTGGFTDCLLKSGATRVYGIDVGYGQLAWELRQDERVVIFEKTNFRHFELSLIKEPIDTAVVDVSFISLTLILPKLKEILSIGHGLKQVLLLVKPQFEAGPQDVGKKGVVRDEAVILKCVNKIIDCAKGLGFEVLGSLQSPIEGPEGNREQLLALTLLIS